MMTLSRCDGLKISFKKRVKKLHFTWLVLGRHVSKVGCNGDSDETDVKSGAINSSTRWATSYGHVIVFTFIVLVQQENCSHSKTMIFLNHLWINFLYGATTFSLIFTKRDIHWGKLDTILFHIEWKKWWRHTETFPHLSSHWTLSEQKKKKITDLQIT